MSEPEFRIVIPSRYASVRLPGKPLRDIAGKPLVQHVHDRAMACGAVEVLVATDDERIADACRAFGADVCMTSEAHPSGTDRIAEVARLRGWDEDAIVVNLQCDEPLVPPPIVRQVAERLAAGGCEMATLCTPITSTEELLARNNAKVVRDCNDLALYFSRAPIPWHRDGAPGGWESQQRCDGAMRHIGIYGYRVSALQRLCAAPVCEMERAESLEQLRALWLQMRIAVVTALEPPGPGVDTEEDIRLVEEALRA